MNNSSFNKALLLLEILENKEYDELETLLRLESIYKDILELLLELDLVYIDNDTYLLTEKGRNIFYYFNKLNLDNNPLIRVK